MYKIKPNLIVSSNLSTKDIVIDILSKNWPLSLRKIFYSVNKYGKAVSCQAVHKAIQELAKESILKKENNLYKLNIEWIVSMKKYIEMIYSNYKENKPVVSLDGRISQMEFTNLWDMYVAMLDVIESGILDVTNRKIGTCFFYHFWNWMPLTFSKKEYEQILNIAKQNAKCYMIGNKTTSMDRSIAGFYEKLGWRTVVGKQVAQPDVDTVVHGDTVMHIYFSNNIQKAMNNQFERIDKPRKLDIHELYKNIFHLNTKIIVTINHNPSLAMQLHSIGEALIPKEKRYKDFYIENISSIQKSPGL